MSAVYDDRKFFAKIKTTLWLLLLVGIPVLQFLLLYVWVKVDSVVLAFQTYNGEKFVSAGLDNFKQVFSSLASGELSKMFLESFKVYLIGLLFFPVHILVAYLIWYKIPAAGVFKVILYLPSILPGMIFTLAFKYFVEKGFPVLFNNPSLGLLLSNKNTTFATLMFWSVFMSLPGELVIYLGTISSVNESVVEYGKLEGLGLFGQFWHIILPHIYPTVSTFLISGVCGMLTADYGLYAFFGEKNAQYIRTFTIGYHMQVLTLQGQKNYGYLSALGLVITFVAIPITFAVRHFLEKYGPSEE